MQQRKIGLWLIGARGSVAATTILGLAALRRGLVPPLGLVSTVPQLAGLELADWDRFAVGGHEIRQVSLVEETRRLAADMRAFPPGLVEQCLEDLAEADARIVPGTAFGTGPTIQAMAGDQVPREDSPAETVGRLAADLAAFRQQNDLTHVVVVNVASTEPPVAPVPIPAAWDELEALLARPAACPLPASTLYAIAAAEADCSYINFTPSLGSAPPAVDRLFRLRGGRHMGCDGKTGETLMKSVLAPLFAKRNLQVLSWVGHNIFGNMDGKVLDDPANKASKVASKDHLVHEILGYRPQTHVSIEYIESLGEWKTAWDHIHFAGFLGARMTLQFIWQGCDSILAAPLVLDLARLTELAWRRGQTGLLTFLASFFKSPYGVAEHDFARQFQMLEDWAAAVRGG